MSLQDHGKLISIPCCIFIMLLLCVYLKWGPKRSQVQEVEE